MRTFKVIRANCKKALAEYDGPKFDAVVTDPPYELGLMGKKWDSTGIAYDVEMWKLVLASMKPGAHLLAFGGTRTYHRMVCAIEDAGFEIRDCIQWNYISGFPKSTNISKEIDKSMGVEPKVVGSYRVGGNALTPTKVKGGTYAVGAPNSPAGDLFITEPVTRAAKKWKGWGSALKPANEPIVIARKPLAGTLAANVQTHGVGGINIDGCRVGNSKPGASPNKPTPEGETVDYRFKKTAGDPSSPMSNPNIGRHPANVIMDEGAGAMFDAQSGDRPGMSGGGKHSPDYTGGMFGAIDSEGTARGDNGGASRCFYCPKTSRKEREAGLTSETEHDDSVRLNTHPTVKPVALMRYLVRLVTPKGGLVLDPFTGSGSTGIACVHEGASFIGFERKREYVKIANERIAAAQKGAEG